MSAAVHVSVFAKTDLGQTREHNEDSFLVADLSTGAASLMPESVAGALGTSVQQIALMLAPRGALTMPPFVLR